MSEFLIDRKNFQTDPRVCEYMADLLPFHGPSQILEPTPGIGNLVKALEARGHSVHYPNGDFWQMDHSIEKYDAIVMNPPFSPMRLGIRFLKRAMLLSDNIICLFPILLLTNSQHRQIEYSRWGFKRLITLPRHAFPGSRVQCCIMVLQKGYCGPTTYEFFNLPLNS